MFASGNYLAHFVYSEVAKKDINILGTMTYYLLACVECFAHRKDISDAEDLLTSLIKFFKKFLSLSLSSFFSLV